MRCCQDYENIFDGPSNVTGVVVIYFGCHSVVTLVISKYESYHLEHLKRMLGEQKSILCLWF